LGGCHVDFGVFRPATFGGEIGEEKRAKLEAELESVEQTLREALDFINDDRHLTSKGITSREALRREVEEIEKDLEAARQEHRLD
jgi:hypothetical protein